MEKQANASNYYKLLTEQIVTEYQDYAQASGIPKESFNGIVNEKVVKENVNAYFVASFKGVEYENDKKELEIALKQEIYDYENIKMRKITPESDVAIKAFITKSLESYDAMIRLPYLVQFGQKINQFKSKLLMVEFILVICLMMISAFLFKLLEWGHRLMRYLSYSLIGSGLMVMVVPSYILLKNDIKRISITSKPLYNFLTLYVTNFFQSFIYVGSLLVLAGMLFIFISEVRRARLI